MEFADHNPTGQSMANPTAIPDAIFDLGAIDTREACNKPFDLELKHPVTKTGTGVFIQIVGKDSDAYRQVVETIANQDMSRAAMRRKQVEFETISALEKKNINALVAATVGWYTLVPVRDETQKVVDHKRVDAIALKGEHIPFTHENAFALYKQILPAREQVQEGINDLENFMQK